jgi:hypothetical protein
MTEVDLINSLASLDSTEQKSWMFNFGYELTVWARDCYGGEQREVDAKALMGFNEIQHRVYGRIAALVRSDEWTEQSYIEGVMQMARAYGIEGQVSAVLKKTTSNLPQPEKSNVYVKLLDEGTDTIRPTTAISLGNGLYELQPTDDYDAADETWEFLPGTKVEAIKTTIGGKLLLLAVATARGNRNNNV